MADTVATARRGQVTPDGYYNVERMLKRMISSGVRSAALRHLHGCARPVAEEMMGGARRSTMEEPAQGVVVADKVMVF